MVLKRQKICLLFCGGSSLVGRNNKLFEVRKKSDIEPWLSEITELAILADLQPVFIFGAEDETVAAETWAALVMEIQKRYQTCDGFVITHSFDSINYSGAALAFMLGNLGKPVIMTGAQDIAKLPDKKNINRYHTLGIRANLIDAVQVATQDIAEVGIMVGNQLFRATQIARKPGTRGNFTNWSGEKLGEIDFGIKFSEYRQLRRRTPLLVQPEIEQNVFTIALHPGYNLRASLKLLNPSLKGLIIMANDISLPLSDFLLLEKYSAQHNMPVFILAENKAPQPQKTKLIILPPMIPEIALVKVMCALGQKHTPSGLRQYLNENIAGEILKLPVQL